MAEANGMVAPTLTDIQLSKWRMQVPTNQREATKMKITTIGIDLAKNVFQVRVPKSACHRCKQIAKHRPCDSLGPRKLGEPVTPEDDEHETHAALLDA